MHPTIVCFGTGAVIDTAHVKDIFSADHLSQIRQDVSLQPCRCYRIFRCNGGSHKFLLCQTAVPCLLRGDNQKLFSKEPPREPKMEVHAKE